MRACLGQPAALPGRTDIASVAQDRDAPAEPAASCTNVPPPWPAPQSMSSSTRVWAILAPNSTCFMLHASCFDQGPRGIVNDIRKCPDRAKCGLSGSPCALQHDCAGGRCRIVLLHGRGSRDRRQSSRGRIAGPTGGSRANTADRGGPVPYPGTESQQGTRGHSRGSVPPDGRTRTLQACAGPGRSDRAQRRRVALHRPPEMRSTNRSRGGENSGSILHSPVVALDPKHPVGGPRQRRRPPAIRSVHGVNLPRNRHSVPRPPANRRLHRCRSRIGGLRPVTHPSGPTRDNQDGGIGEGWYVRRPSLRHRIGYRVRVVTISLHSGTDPHLRCSQKSSVTSCPGAPGRAS